MSESPGGTGNLLWDLWEHWEARVGEEVKTGGREKISKPEEERASRRSSLQGEPQVSQRE